VNNQPDPFVTHFIAAGGVARPEVLRRACWKLSARA